MRRVLWLLLALLLAWNAAARADEGDPDAPAPATTVNGTVTLSLERFLTLTHPKSGGSSSGQAPVHFLLSRGDYRVSAAEKWVRVEGEVTLEVYSGSWVQVPLVPAQVVLQEARLDGKPLLVQAKEGQVTGLVRSSGTHKLNLTYYLPLSSSGPTRSFALSTPGAAVSTVHFEMPGKDIQVNTTPKIPWTTRSAAGKTWLDGALPARAGEGGVTFSWTPLAANPALQGKVHKEAARIYARLYTLANLSERDVRLTSQVDLSILRNELEKVQLELPSGVDVSDVQSDKLAHWAVNDAKAQRQLELQFSEPISGDHRVTVTYERAVDLDPEKGKDKDHWSLPSLNVTGAERVKGSVGVFTTGGVEATQAGLQEARSIDVQELPPEVTQMAANPVTLAFEYHQQPYLISLDLRKGEELPVLTAAIDHAEGLTLITDEGKLVSSFTYTVRNNRKQYLQLELPPKANVYGTFVNGQAAKPVQGDKGELRLPLVTSGANAQGGFPVEITYVQEMAAGQYLGTDFLMAPKVDVPVCGLNWSVYLPSGQQILSTGGSLSPGGLQAAPPAQAPQGRMDAPGAAGGGSMAATDDLSMQAGDEGMVSGKLKAAAETRAVNRPVQAAQFFKDNNRMAQMVQQATQGAFPVRVEIPREGQLLSFSQLIVTNEAPVLTITYFSAPVKTALWVAFLALATGLGLGASRYPGGWKLPLAGILGLWLASSAVDNTPVAFLQGAWTLAMMASALAWVLRHLPFVGQGLQALWARRHMKLGLLLVLALSLPAAADPSGGSGTVTMSLQEFLKLSHGTGSSTAPSDKPPAPFLMTGGSYTITPNGPWAQVEAEIGLTSLGSGWQEVDLLPSSVVLKSCSLDGHPVALFPKEDHYRCLLRGAGSHRLQLTYHLPVASEGNHPSLSFLRPATQVSSVRLVLPAGQKVTVSPEAPLNTHSQGGKTVAEGALPPGESPARFSWSPQTPGADRPRGGAARMAARVFSLATVSETVVRVKHSVNYQILSGDTDILEVTLPQGVEVVEVTSPNLAGWTSADKANRKLVTVALNQRTSGSVALTVVAEAPLAKIDSTWDLPSLEVLGVDRVKGSIGLEAGSGIEVTAVDKGLVGARGVDVQELPGDLTSMTDKPLVLAYEYHSQPYQVSLESRKGKEVAVLTASIDQAQGTTLVTPDGKMVTSLTFQIKNNHKQHLELELPAKAEVWSAFVNGKAVKPVKGEQGKVRLPLASSANGAEGVQSFPAEIVYAQEFAPHSLLNHLALVTPKADMPISSLGWALFLPEDWAVLSQSGNLRPAASLPPMTGAPAPPPSAPRSLPRPAAQLKGGAVPRDEEALNEDTKERRQSVLSNIVRETEKGQLPVQLSLPRVGQMHCYSRLMVTNEASSLDLTVSSRTSQRWGAWMLFGLLLVLGAWLATRPTGWRALVALTILAWLAPSVLPNSLAGLVPIPTLALHLSLGLWLVIHLGDLMRSLTLRWSKPEISMVLTEEEIAAPPPDPETP